jgi:TPR repeat protein
MKTETLLELLVNDNQQELIKIYSKEKWEECIDFNLVYEKVKDFDNPSINNILGYMYRHGYGVDKNNEKALYYYQLAANKGSICANNNLGYTYEHGYGVDKNYEKAIHYYQ